MQLQKELDVESDALDDNYTPYQIEFPLDAGCRKKISIVCTIEDVYERMLLPLLPQKWHVLMR